MSFDKDTFLKVVHDFVTMSGWKPSKLLKILHPQNVGIGDIIVAEGGRTRALVLVTDYDEEAKIFEIALIHNEPDYATDKDIHITKEESHLPFDCVVQMDLICYIDEDQAVDLIITDANRASLFDLPFLHDIAPMNEHKIPRERRGMPCRGRHDCRWDFKVEELERLQDLCSECVTRLMGD